MIGEGERSEDVRHNGKKHANSLVPTAFPTFFPQSAFWWVWVWSSTLEGTEIRDGSIDFRGSVHHHTIT